MAERDRKIAELRAIEDQLIALGAGRYTDGDGHIAQVIAEVPSSLGADSHALQSKEDEEAAREIAGDVFKKLFDRVLFYRPCSGYAELAPKILTPAKANRLLGLTHVPGRPISGKRAHVRW